MNKKRRFPECRWIQRRAKWGQNSGIGRRVIFPYSKVSSFCGVPWSPGSFGTRVGTCVRIGYRIPSIPSRARLLFLAGARCRSSCRRRRQMSFRGIALTSPGLRGIGTSTSKPRYPPGSRAIGGGRNSVCETPFGSKKM